MLLYFGWYLYVYTCALSYKKNRVMIVCSIFLSFITSKVSFNSTSRKMSERIGKLAKWFSVFRNATAFADPEFFSRGFRELIVFVRGIPNFRWKVGEDRACRPTILTWLQWFIFRLTERNLFVNNLTFG